MVELIKLQNEKGGVNNDAAVRPIRSEILRQTLCHWSIPYALPTDLNQEPAEKPVIIGYSFPGLEGSVEVIPYGNDEKFSGLANIVVNDDDLSDWFTLNFSNTTTTDKVVASTVMIGGLQKSTEPDHDIHPGAGLSSIKLLGEKSDWEEILRRVDGRIPTFGEEAIQWCKVPVPVMQGMISSFDFPNLALTKEFWHKACYFDGTDLRNGKETMTRWITAFCF